MSRMSCSAYGGCKMRNAEATIQASIVAWARQHAIGCVVFSTSIDGFCTPAEGAKRRWMGLLAGIPDLVLVGPDGRAHFIEVKVPGGKATPDQRELMERLTALGSPCRVCCCLEEAQRTLTEWGLVPEMPKELAA
jgi:hypothetical protein